MKTEIIAEIGLVHEGSLGLAMSLSSAAIEHGADIVKFQAHFPEVESSSLEKFRVPFAVQDETRWDYWQRTAFSIDEWCKLKQHVENLGALFSVSVFSTHAFEIFKSMQIEVIKLGSGDFNNDELFDTLHDFSGTVVLSTGMATWLEIEKKADWMKNSSCSHDSAILQCTSSYPTPLDQVGINVMLEIQKRFGVLSGLSDHTMGITSSLAAIAYGARYVEKHVTPSPYMFGPDVAASISFEELRQIEQFRNELVQVMKPIDKDAMAEEMSALKLLFGRSLALKRNLPTSSRIELDDFCLRKPGGGYDWDSRHSFVGRALRRPYNTQEILNESHFEE